MLHIYLLHTILKRLSSFDVDFYQKQNIIENLKNNILSLNTSIVNKYSYKIILMA